MCSAQDFVYDQPAKFAYRVEIDGDVVSRVFGHIAGVATDKIATMHSYLNAHSLPLFYDCDYGFAVEGRGCLNPWIEVHFAQLYSCFTAYGLDTSQPFVDLLADARALGPTRIVPFFGVDNSYLFGFLYPWISIHLGLCNFLPAAMQCSYFLLRNGAKLSSSRNNAVWARDLVGDVGLRRARSALAASSPEGSNRTFDESFGGFVSATDGVEEIGTSSDAFASVAALRDRIARCADPRVFSLTEIANLIDKATAYAARLKRLCDKEKESAAITVEISALVDQLSI